jgi:hypothetical protein
VEHVVFFSASDGSPAYRRTASLEDAVRVVEHMRNIEGVEDVHVYSLEPVTLSFRPYYRVEVNAGHQPQHSVPGEAPAPVAQPVAAAPVAPPAPVEQVVHMEPVAPAAPMAEPVFMPVAAAPQAPVFEVPAEQVPALTVVGQSSEQPAEDPSSNGRGGRGLGFFTR